MIVMFLKTSSLTYVNNQLLGAPGWPGSSWSKPSAQGCGIAKGNNKHWAVRWESPDQRGIHDIVHILYMYIYMYTPIDTYNTIVQCWICIYMCIYIYTLTNIAAILSTRQFQAEYQEIPQVQKRFSKAFQDLFWRLVHRPSCCARDFRARKGGIPGGWI